MKIKEIRAVSVDLTPKPKTSPRKPSRRMSIESVAPMSRYPEFKGHRSAWAAKEKWKWAACVVTADDGTWGLGVTPFGPPVAAIINDQFAPRLVGQDCMATEKMWDWMNRLSHAHSSAGLASYAISAVDVALWDLKGKLLGRPVYELLGGPQKDKIFCYATGFDNDWYVELGFKATKIFLIHGPADGLDGLNRNIELVAQTREMIGDDVELMVDCWMSLDVEYTVRLAELLRPYRIKWLEDSLLPEDLEGYAQIRQRLPWLTLATGEHWYTTLPFMTAAKRSLVDIFQPDVLWVGGISGCVRICHIAEAAGLSVITHGGMNWPYGQHLAYATPAIPWGERSQGVSAPGVPLEEMTWLPGTPVIKDGYLVPSDAPGFGLEVTMEWLESVTLP